MVKSIMACIEILFFSSMFPVYANGDNPQKSAIPLNTLEALKARQIELKSAIDSQIGDASCGKNEDCRVLAIGANPCGGPEAYQPYSLLGTDVDRLKKLADQYKTVRKALHAKMGTLGACIVIPQPQVQCKNSRCIAAPKQDSLIF